MRPTRALIDLNHLDSNLRTLRNRTPAGTLQMAVVKADAYGHGALEVARKALHSGCHWLGLATVQEAAELRSAGIDGPALVLGPAPEADTELLLEHRLRATVCTRESALALSARASAAGVQAPIHVKVDSGMGRLGVAPHEALSFIRWLEELPGLALEGVYSHFASADEADLGFAHRQLACFRDVLHTLRQAGVAVAIRHMANTAATLALADSHFDLVRNGIGIYGLAPSPQLRHVAELRPILRWETEISQLKEVPAGTPLSYGGTFTTTRPSRIATLPVGYADGYSRLLSNRGHVVLRGTRVPVVGRVCMDMILVDVSDVPDTRVADPITLIGREGGAEVSADEIAERCHTINYEVTCNIGKRVPRVYTGR